MGSSDGADGGCSLETGEATKSMLRSTSRSRQAKDADQDTDESEYCDSSNRARSIRVEDKVVV